MSGLLRRIKRSRTADAGDAPAEGKAAAPDGAPATADAPAGPSTPATGELADAQPAFAEPSPAPAVPAGREPVELTARPPAGRRGRLRRRLRYLRRARELMLRDLGGLFYEIHRTGGGRVDAYATVVEAKVERIAGLDAEARALETALVAPRGDVVVFEPGVGGTCAACGELFGSSAHFCSNCGTPTGAAAPAPARVERPVMPPAPAPEHEPEPEPMDQPQEPPGSEQPTRALDEPGGEPTRGSSAGERREEPAVEEAPTATGDTPAPASDERPQEDAPAPSAGETGDAAGDRSGDDRGSRNGDTAPLLAPGDPLVARESGP